MASRTQIVCLCEGGKGASIDEVFINRLIRSLDPGWLKPWGGSNKLRIAPCGGRKSLVARMPAELQACLVAGADTTLMVWADCDHDCPNADALKSTFWKEAQRQGITKEQFDRVVFVFAKDRLENWIEFLQTGKTDEHVEGPRVQRNRDASDAAMKLAMACKDGKPLDDLPPSLMWSCKNWQSLRKRMAP